METVIGIAIGLAATVIGYLCGFFTCLHAYKAGAKLVDRIHHDQVPFDEDLNTEPLDSHTGGRNIDEEDED